MSGFRGRSGNHLLDLSFTASGPDPDIGPFSECLADPVRCRLPEPGANMRRREFIAGLAGAAAMPLAARAQPAIPVVGDLGHEGFAGAVWNPSRCIPARPERDGL